MLLRAATPDDAEAIARVQIAAWRHAYEEIVGPERLEYLDLDEHAADWRARLGGSGSTAAEVAPAAGGEAGPETATVAEQDGRIVAVVAATGTGELSALYVHPVAQGAGVGSGLLARAEAALRAQGATTASGRVFAANWWARRFLEGRGWSPDPDAPGGDDDPPTERWLRPL